MVTGGQHIRAQLEQFFRDRRREAEAARGILRVHDDQFDLIRFDDMVQVVADDLPPGTAKDVADKKYLQDARSRLDAITRAPSPRQLRRAQKIVVAGLRNVE